MKPPSERNELKRGDRVVVHFLGTSTPGVATRRLTIETVDDYGIEHIVDGWEHWVIPWATIGSVTKEPA